MRKPALLVLLLQVLVLPLAAQTPADCSLCVGIVGNETAVGGRLYTYQRLAESDLASFAPVKNTTWSMP